MWGCGTVGNNPVDTEDPVVPSTLPTPTVPRTFPLFDPASGDPTRLPLPNDLLRDPTTGKIQIPDKPEFQREPFLALAAQRGFSTLGDIIIPFQGGVVGNSPSPQNIRVFEAATNATVPVKYTVQRPLVPSQEINSNVLLTPIQPLKPLTTYIVVITGDLQGSGGPVLSTNLIRLLKLSTPLIINGVPQVTGVDVATATKLEPLRQFYQPIWEKAEAATGIPRAQMAFAFQFGTQPLFAVLPELHGIAVQDNFDPIAPNAGQQQVFDALGPNIDDPTVPGVDSTNQIDVFFNVLRAQGKIATIPPHGNIGRIMLGAIQARDYIGPGVVNMTTGFFQGEGTALGSPVVSQQIRVIPYILCFPKIPVTPNAPTATAQAVIYQHGINRNKGDVLALADNFNSKGLALIGIDMVLHGDLAIPGQPSGTGFLNPGNLRNSRDNIRQSAVNLFYLTQAIKAGKITASTQEVSFPAPPDPPFGFDVTFNLAPTNPGFIAQSMGSIVGSSYIACETHCKFGVLNVPGGRLNKMLLASNSFGPPILSGLEAQGIKAGTDAFNQFLLILQTVADDADPANYATHWNDGALRGGAANAPQILVQEAMADATIPNSATEDLVNAAVINQVQPPVVVRYPLLPLVDSPTSGASGLAQYPDSAHFFLLDPSFGQAVAARTMALTFLGTGFQTGNGVINTTSIVP